MLGRDNLTMSVFPKHYANIPGRMHATMKASLFDGWLVGYLSVSSLVYLLDR